MDVVFKKYFWVINLVGIMMLAWFVATGINDWVASKLFAVPRSQTASAGSKTASAPPLGRVTRDEHAADELHRRKVFDLDPPQDPDAEKPEEDEGEKKEEEEPEGELAESKLPIDLIGTLVAEDGGSSMATLSVEGANKLGWEGSEFLDGKAKLVTIAPRHVVVKEETDFKVIKLWADKQQAGKKLRPGQRPPRPGAVRPSPSAPVKPRPKSVSKNSGRADYSKGVKKTGAYDYEIDRGMLDEHLADLSKLGTQARIVPNYRGGKYQGFKLVGVRPGSLYRAIGIRSGDVIKAINGRPIDSPNKAIELFDKLKNASNISLDIERRGQQKQLGYSIK